MGLKPGRDSTRPASQVAGLGRALIAAGRAHARATATAHRAIAASDSFVAGLLDGALTPPERTRLGASIYDASPGYRGNFELFPFEERWFDARLPRGGGHVLVGGCGSGREVAALLAAGYTVTAFDPAESLLALARDAAPGANLHLESYESWSRRDDPDAPYDAVLLGWGSLSHVHEHADREALFDACAAACPHGPILASVWMKTRRGGGQARAIGERLGSLVGRRRGAGRPTGDLFDPTLGFVHAFEDDELDALGQRIGRSLIREGSPADYPHFTWPAP